MKTRRSHPAWIAVGMVFLCRFAEAQSVSPSGAAAFANEFGGHPVISALVHIVFLSVLLGVGSTIVAVLFKPPFRE